ncbi:conjugal transfer protein TraF [Paenibacillus sp. GCM10027629]|uniref:conjugal transfer protein TraF n=1 Tax=Paenibacillus sp. GCM10027629 TaxID=3273414 RepID=UPI003642D151
MKKHYWLLSGIVLLLLVLLGISSIWYDGTTTEMDESQVGLNEIKGTAREVRAQLMGTINSDEQSFIYLYEPDCKLCTKMEPIINASAERNGLTLQRLNLHKYKDILGLKNEKGIPLINFYKELPAVAYYKNGWLIAWAEGDQSEKIYDEYFEHFRFGDEDEHDQEHE